MQRVLLPKAPSEGKGPPTDVSPSTTDEDDAAGAPGGEAGATPPTQRRLADGSTTAEDSGWAPPPHGITVRSFIRTAVGSQSLKQRLEALRHRAHTGRWDDAIIHLVWRCVCCM